MNKGFSLLEVIAVLLLLGVLALSATISMLPITEGLFQARENAQSAQKTQFAMIRMVREFTTITNVAASDARSITYDFLDPSGASFRHSLAWAGNAGDPLLLENVPLSDDVGAFELRYYAAPGSAAEAAWGADMRIIEVVLENVQGNHRYTNRIAPRNLAQGN